MKKIEFFNLVPGVADLYPIIPSSQYKPQWAIDAKEKYLRDKANQDTNTHIYRCPGIFEVLGQGYLMRCPWDVTIQTYGDGSRFSWVVPNASLNTVLGTDPVTFHSGDRVIDVFPPNPQRLNTIIKLITGWSVKAPLDTKFLIIPYPYPDDYAFQFTPGVLDISLSDNVNAQLWWNVTNGVHTIMAGTPLCLIIPMSNESYKLEVRDATPEDILWNNKRAFWLSHSFNKKYNVIRNMYKQLKGKA